MKKTFFIWLAVFVALVILGLILILAGVFKPASQLVDKNAGDNKQLITSGNNLEEEQRVIISNPIDDLKNLPYTIEGETIVLQNGTASTQAALGDGTTTVTNYFGNEVQGDISGDGQDDFALLLEQSPAGSGRFYYLAAVLGGVSGYQVLNTVFLGDRIAPQSTEIKNGEIIVNYADRKAGEPMSATPSVGVSGYFKVVDGQLLKMNYEPAN